MASRLRLPGGRRGTFSVSIIDTGLRAPDPAEDKAQADPDKVRRQETKTVIE
jgi:hypothetical protein